MPRSILVPFLLVILIRVTSFYDLKQESKSMIIDIRAISKSESLFMSGEISEDIWEFQDSDLIKPAGQLIYEAEASVVSEELLVRGDFSAKFTFECTHCLVLFKKTIKLKNHSILTPIEGKLTIDLTNALREDIILALPNFTKCDQGDEITEPCPASGDFIESLNAQNNGEDPTNPLPSKQWEALDKFNID